jgi:hypothetical protein
VFTKYPVYLILVGMITLEIFAENEKVRSVRYEIFQTGDTTFILQLGPTYQFFWEVVEWRRSGSGLENRD